MTQRGPVTGFISFDNPIATDFTMALSVAFSVSAIRVTIASRIPEMALGVATAGGSAIQVAVIAFFPRLFLPISTDEFTLATGHVTFLPVRALFAITASSADREMVLFALAVLALRRGA